MARGSNDAWMKGYFDGGTVPSGGTTTEGGSTDGYAGGGGIHIKPSHKGLLHKDLGVPAGKPIPAGKLASAKNSSDPAVRKRATFAQNAKSWHHG